LPFGFKEYFEGKESERVTCMLLTNLSSLIILFINKSALLLLQLLQSKIPFDEAEQQFGPNVEPIATPLLIHLLNYLEEEF